MDFSIEKKKRSVHLEEADDKKLKLYLSSQ